MASALYHSLLAPTQFTDSDGRYMGMDGAIHTAPEGQSAFSSYSLWDTYRALHPLITLIAPDKARQFTQDLIRQATQSRFGPRSGRCRGGNRLHDRLARRGGDGRGDHQGHPRRLCPAWPAIRKRAFDPAAPDQDNSLGRDYYDSRGWIPADKIFESVSRTLEYAYDDHAMAVIAEAVGAHEDASALRKRAELAHLFDAQRGFMRPRLDNGQFAEPYDPVALGHSSQWRDFTESNGWQATFLNQHDVYGLIALFGGAERSPPSSTRCSTHPRCCPPMPRPTSAVWSANMPMAMSRATMSPISMPMRDSRGRRRPWCAAYATRCIRPTRMV
jgi:putative alpha-1,2-mannosidase